MTDTIITVQNLSKRYLVGHQSANREYYTSLRDVIGREFHNFIRKASDLVRGNQIIQGDEIEEFWALKDISFEVKQGEVVGIIGRNGAGKSTLLKILSRITQPSSGRVVLRGRVASLLEVGTGFHPELTGRENIFLNGAILGMSQREIRKKFDEIVTFSEVERFLDTPVKRYSSGMYVRLAFAVAAHLEPEILIIDEVLAVGDAKFQEKCLGKMKDVAVGGRTVLFVSHNMSAVMQLTQRAILLSGGQIDFMGPPTDAVERYLQNSKTNTATVFDVSTSNRPIRGTDEAKILSLRFERSFAYFKFLEPIRYAIRIRVITPIDKIRVSMTIYSASGVPIGSCFSPEIEGFAGGEEHELEVCLPPIRLARGSYFCAIAIGRGTNKTAYVNYDLVLNTLTFEVGAEETSAGAMAEWNYAWGNISFPDLTIQSLSPECKTSALQV